MYMFATVGGGNIGSRVAMQNMHICWLVDSVRMISLQKYHTCITKDAEETHVCPHYRNKCTCMGVVTFSMVNFWEHPIKC